MPSKAVGNSIYVLLQYQNLVLISFALKLMWMKFIATPFVYLLSLLPFPILYGLSYCVYILLYRLIGYRKQVVITNLRNSFPNKSEKEINGLAADFYRYLCDLFLETFKTLTISKETMLKHCYLSAGAQHIFDKYAAENRNIILVLGHYGNWEWAGNTFALCCKQQLYVIYHPLGSQYFNDLMYRMRSRFGTKLIPMKNTFKEMLNNKKEVNATAFIADQTPSSTNAYWTTFLNQETPVFWGTEVIAKKLNTPVVYITLQRRKRGFYELDAEILHDNPQVTTEGEISELHTRRLEKDILANPATWLWSHRRWKHKRGIVN